MTKSSKYLVAAVLLMVFSSMPGAAEVSVAVEEANASNVVSNYLSAVTAGDIVLLRTYLAPSLLKQREALLANPGYAEKLRSAYASATFEIMDARMLGSGKVQVDARIVLNGNDTVHNRFLLGKNGDRYLIEAEN